jgi:serine/threonine-protein kinase
MSYCLNPNCPNPENIAYGHRCQFCDSPLLLRDRYRVHKALGQGGFGATFLAVDEALPGEPSCVIKQLRPSGNTPQVLRMARELFEREAVTLGKIGNHPQVPRLLDYFEEHEQFYLVQEYISGSTLQQLVKQNGVFSEAGIKQFLSEILPLLQYIHECQVIHRDIKPANIIRREQDNRLVLIDFGAVKNQVTQATINVSEHTALTAYAIGTPGFAPPEQMAMRPVYASDIYALGVTCVYLLTGKSPKDLEYNPSTGELMWESHVQASDHLIDVLRKMMEVSVRNRYQTANDVLRALNLEPYLESLSKNLIIQPSSGKERANQRWEDNGNSGGNISGLSIAQVAAAIRARRAKTSEGTGIVPAQKPLQALPKKNTTLVSKCANLQQHKSKQMRQLDNQSLLTAYLKGRRDFVLHDLSLIDLQGANLPETNFHSSQLQRANLQGANLYNSDLGQACLNRANLRDANLSKAFLNNADLEGADLRGADLSYAYLQNANLRGANLCGANLTGAKISDEQLALAKMNWMTVRPNGKRGFL